MRKFTLALIVLGFAYDLTAQKSFTEIIANKKLDKELTLNWPGNLLDEQYQQLSLKNVALVSFYIEDEGFSQDAGFVISTMGMSEDGGNRVATDFYRESIDKMKGVFESNGLELLTPDQFLDSDVKREAYENFEMEVGLVAKLVLKAVNSIAKAATKAGIKQAATPAGYEYIPAAMGAGDTKLGESMSSLAQSLGVDAVAVAFVNTKTDKKATSFMSTGLHIFGTNPIAKDPNKKYPGNSYTTGMNIGGTAYQAKPIFEFVEYKKGQRISAEYAGYGALMEKISIKLITSVKQRMVGN